MESSQSMLNPETPETDNSGEAIPDPEELNDIANEESKTERGIFDSVIEEEDTVKTLPGNEEEEPSLIPDVKTSVSSGRKESSVSSRKQSRRSIHVSQRSQQPVTCQSLLNPTPLPQQPSKDAGAKGSVAWISPRTGKEMKSKFNQTSVVWERKPLAEILHPSGKIPQKSKDTEKDKTDAIETITLFQDVETERDAMQGSVHREQLLEGAEGQDGSPPPVKQPEEQASQRGSQRTIVSQPPQDRKLSQLQPPNKATMKGDIKLISKKSGKEMKCSFNQTSFIWERKPLAQILHPPSAKTPSPEKDITSPEEAEIKPASVQEAAPQLEQQELEQGSQQLEEQESKKDNGQEAQEAPEAPEEAPEAPEEALEAPEGALEAPEEAPEAPEETPEAPEEAPEAPEEAPDAPEEAVEEAPKEAPEAPEEVAEAPEEAVEEAPEAPSEEAPEASEEAPES